MEATATKPKDAPARRHVLVSSDVHRLLKMKSAESDEPVADIVDRVVREHFGVDAAGAGLANAG